jgi:peptidoglycan hydrolase-like protein with peptidoglycan-binding domain
VRIRIVSLSALALTLTLGLAACGSGSSGYAPDPAPPSYPPVAATAVPQAGTHTSVNRTPHTSTTSRPAQPAQPAFKGLQMGDNGPKVRALQQRLSQLGFWIGGTDGTYGDTTQQAVLAAQKALGLSRDGVAGPITLAAVKRGVSVSARSTSGHWLEIDKTRQLLLVVTNGKVDAILNTSTGSGQAYRQGGQTYTALTPSGQFAITRQVDRMDPGPLGDLWRPKYFNGGIAVHGAPVVPGYPASHGCTRVSNAAIDWIWNTDQAPIGTRVWVY